MEYKGCKKPLSHSSAWSHSHSSSHCTLAQQPTSYSYHGKPQPDSAVWCGATASPQSYNQASSIAWYEAVVALGRPSLTQQCMAQSHTRKELGSHRCPSSVLNTIVGLHSKASAALDSIIPANYCLACVAGHLQGSFWQCKGIFSRSCEKITMFDLGKKVWPSAASYGARLGILDQQQEQEDSESHVGWQGPWGAGGQKWEDWWVEADEVPRKL